MNRYIAKSMIKFTRIGERKKNFRIEYVKLAG